MDNKCLVLKIYRAIIKHAVPIGIPYRHHVLNLVMKAFLGIVSVLFCFLEYKGFKTGYLPQIL